MKKVFIVFVLIILSLSLFSSVFASKDVSIDYKKTEQIKKEWQTCLDTNFDTDYTMAQCNIEAQEKYEEQIKVALEKLKKVVTAQQYDEILKTQKKWEEFISVDKKMLEFVVEPQKSESGFFYLQSTNIQAENYERRLNELDDLYFNRHTIHNIMKKLNKKYNSNLLP